MFKTNQKLFSFRPSGLVALHLLAAASVVIPLTHVSAQQIEPPGIAYQRWKYFHDQRAYPFSQIPRGAYQAARQNYRQAFTAASPQVGPPAAAISFNAWSSIGPAPINEGSFNASGRLNSIAIDPTNTNVIYVGAAQGGVWKTTNGGTSWTPLTDAQCSDAMGSIVVDPVNPNIVYAGTGEENFSLDSYYGCGVLRSTDGGTTWTQQGASTFVFSSGGGQSISRVLVDSSTAGSTTSTHVFVASDQGVYRSLDSGSSWSQVLAGTATDIVADNAGNVYAALGNIFGSASNGIYKSTNNGAWAKLAGGLPTTNVGRINLAIAPSSPTTLYASVQSTSTFGLLGIWKSIDGGSNWTQLSATGASCASQCWYDMYIYVDPTNVNFVYFGGFSVYRSTNGGSSFSDIGSSIHVDQHAFVFQPSTATTIYAGNDGGIFKSTNSGSTWTSLNTNIATAQFYPGFSLDPSNASNAMGGLQDNDVVLYSGNPSWNIAGLGCDGGFTAIDFTTPTTKYGECQGGGSFSGPYRSDSGGPFVQKTTGINLNDQMSFIPPIAMSPTNSQTLYFGTYRVYQTTSRGDAWTAISPSLTKTSGCFFCYISTIAEAKSSSGQVIYAGTADGNVQITTNGGTNWAPIISGLPNRNVTYLAVDPTNAANAFVVVSGFGTGHVFKTTNSGGIWSDISGNLPNIPVNTILLDPGAPTTNIYVGTDLGVFRTTDGGTTWTAFNYGFPNVAVFDLAFNQTSGVLMAATHGRSAWQAVAIGVLQVSPTTNVASTGNQGGPFSPSSFQYQLQASVGSVGYSISGVPSWLTVTPSTSGTVTTSPTTVTFTVNSSANSLVGGAYNATITFTDTTNHAIAQTISAALTVIPPPNTLVVNPATNISSSGFKGGPFSPASFQYQLSTSSGSVNYSISDLPAWLNASTTSGTASSTPTTVTFTINSNANGLAFGAYNATISFANTTNGQGNQTRTASLTVNSGGGGGSTPAMTYVSARTGSDSGLCPITAPCATLNYALSVTDAGGQVTVIDGGVFGPILLTKEVSIVGDDPKQSFQIVADPTAAAGCVAATPGSCGTNNGFGVEAAASASDTIKLTNTDVTAGAGGTGALKFSSGGKLQLSENVYRGNDIMTGPIIALYPNNPGTTQAQVYFSYGDVGFNNPNSANAGAVEVKPSGNTSLKLHFNHVEVHNASYGIRTDSSLLSGPSINVATAISESEFFSFANAAVNAFSTAGTGTTNAAFDAVRVLNATVAIKANGPQSTVILTNSTVSGNGTGVQVLNSAHIYTPQNNTIYGNGTDVSGALSSAPPR